MILWRVRFLGWMLRDLLAPRIKAWCAARAAANRKWQRRRDIAILRRLKGKLK